jgi:hypothetical protein
MNSFRNLRGMGADKQGKTVQEKPSNKRKMYKEGRRTCNDITVKQGEGRGRFM